ncbi:hypothetical protein N9L47_06275 [Rhodobacteraceae bacterium]|nr:hypothetical protein [Paracoccaceae bacterium]
MQLLTTTGVYDVEGDRSNPDFLRLVQTPPDGIVVLDGNAGLGADWPAGVWKSLNAAAIAIAILSAPATFEENWPRWKEIYDKVVGQILEFHGEFRIDRDTAQILAINHAIKEVGLNPGTISFHMAIRHYFTTFAGYEDLLETNRIEMDWPEKAEFGSNEFSHAIKSTEEAARQAACRYILGLDDGIKCITLVVEENGTVSLSSELNLGRDWG